VMRAPLKTRRPPTSARRDGKPSHEQVVGTAGGTKYGYDKDGKPFLTKEPKLILNDNNAGKPEGIHLMIGRRPYGRIRQLNRRPADAGVELLVSRPRQRFDRILRSHAAPQAQPR